MTETYGYDKTPTPPRDYDASKVPAEIKKRATWVKTKFTGEDVAEAYGQAMEITGIYSDQAKQIAQQTKTRQDNLETQTAQSVAQMEADKNTIVANATVDSEVILARGGKPTLQARLDETAAQLAQTEKKTEKNGFGEISKYTKTFYDLQDTSGFKHQNFDTGTGVGNPWTVTNETITVVKTNGASVCWLPQKIQDGKISMVWENPNLDVDGVGFVGFMIRGTNVNNGIAIMLRHGTSDNNISMFTVVNGSFQTALMPAQQLTTPESMVKSNTPAQLEVEFYGNNLLVRVNGTTAVNITHSSLLSESNGMVGLIGSAFSEGMTFSNIMVTEKRYDVIPMNLNKVLCAGDSITAGSGASVSSKRWVSLLDAKLKEYNPNVIVANTGKSGATTGNVLTNQIIPALSQGYEIAIVQCGTNDSRIDLNIPHATAIANITSIIRYLKSVNTIPIICTPTPFSMNVTIPEYNETSYWYNVKLVGMIRQLCAKEKILVIDNYPIFNNTFDKMIADKLHPNDDGYELIFQNVWKVLSNRY